MSALVVRAAVDADAPDVEMASLHVDAALWRGPGAAAFGGVVTPAPDIGALARLGARLDPATHLPTPAYLRAPDARLPST